MTKFVVLACNPSKRSAGNYTLWGKLTRSEAGILMTSVLLWIRATEPKDKFTTIEIPDNYRLVSEKVEDRVFTHIELT